MSKRLHDDIYLARFLDKVAKTSACWVWTGGKKPTGYGVFLFRGRLDGAHRASWVLHNGELPHGICVLHRCDNPSCVNPSHLFIGTQKDNARDMAIKERSRTTKLTASIVQAMREHRRNGETFAVIAARYGVSLANARFAVLGITWKHLADMERAA